MNSKKQAKKRDASAGAQAENEQRAMFALCPSVSSAAVTAEYSSLFGEQDLSALVDELSEQTEKLAEGDMSNVEAMLYGQAQALQSIFVNLARRAATQQYLKPCAIYLGLALKAQAQCRATLETLAEVMHPKSPTFVNQQNVAYQQQVNNGDAIGENDDRAQLPARTEKSAAESNKVLEEQDDERLDGGTAGTAGGDDSYLGTMEVLNRR